MNDIVNEIRKILDDELGREDVKINEELTLKNAGVDSIEFMGMLVYLEETFKIEIDFIKYFPMNFADITFKTIIYAVEQELGEND